MDFTPAPMISLGALPEAERPAAAHLLLVITKLQEYLRRFRGAHTLHATASLHVEALFKRATDEPNLIARFQLRQSAMFDPTRPWTGIALRDSAMTIYHYRYLLDSIDFGQCRTLGEWVDINKLKLARKIFKGAFFMANENRNAVAHAGEMASTMEDVKDNSVTSGLDHIGIRMPAEGASAFISDLEVDGKLVTTWYNSSSKQTFVLETDCSKQSLETLQRVTDLVLDAFRHAEEKGRVEHRRQIAELNAVRSGIICAIRALHKLD